jgi:hypothetical protein
MKHIFTALAFLTALSLPVAWLVVNFLGLYEVDACDELVCTAGYPCFEQGDCPST